MGSVHERSDAMPSEKPKRDLYCCPFLDGNFDKMEILGEGGSRKVFRVEYKGRGCALIIPKEDYEAFQEEYKKSVDEHARSGNDVPPTVPTDVKISGEVLEDFSYEIEIWRKLTEGARRGVLPLIKSGNSPVRWALTELAE